MRPQPDVKSVFLMKRFSTFAWTVMLLACLSPRLSAQSSVPTPLLFSGEATVVAPPVANTLYGNGPNQFASLARAGDCSMYAIFAELATQTVQLIQADYQDNLHELSGLTTKADQWTGGCPSPAANNPAYTAHTYGGKLSNGIQIIAVADQGNSALADIYNATISPLSQHFAIVQELTTSYPNLGPMAGGVDLNGDGVADLIIASAGSSPGGFSVYLGTGNGTFQTSPAYSVTTSGNTAVTYFSLCDINGDGKPDIAAIISGVGVSDTLQIFFGNGDGTFTPGPSTTLASNLPVGIPLYVADFNNDGHADVVLGDGELWLGVGDGTFHQGTSLSLPAAISSFTAADFNKDGKLDLVVIAQSGSGQILVYLGNGDGTFQSPTTYASIDSPSYVSSVDIDGDGNLDLVVGENGGGAYIPGLFTVFGSGGLQVLFGNGDGTFRDAVSYNAGSTTYAVGDVNGDNIPDILTPASLLVGDGTGGFTVHSGNQFAGLDPALAGSVMRLVDLNGDHILDAVLTTTSGANSNNPFIALGQAGGTFSSGSFLSSVPNAIDVNVADINGDNIPDLLVLTNPSGQGTGVQLFALLGHGDGSFAAPQQVSLPSGASQSTAARVYAADLNKDGKADLVVVDEGSSSANPPVPGGVYVLLGHGDGTFASATTITAVQNPYDVAIADFNKDGKVDLVVSTAVQNGSGSGKQYDPAIFLGNGDGTFPAQPSGFIGTFAQFGLRLAVSDLNLDGNPDLAMAECCGLAFINIAFGNGDGTFQAAQILHVAVSPTNIALADLNGDGFPDIVTSPAHSTGLITVVMNEYGSLSQGGGGTPDFTVSADPSSVSVSSSGTAESAITITPVNGFTGTVSFSCSGLPANSTCTFSPATVVPSGSAVGTTLTISTGVQSAQLHHQGTNHRVFEPRSKGTPLVAASIAKKQPASRNTKPLLGMIFGGMLLLICAGVGSGTNSLSLKRMARYFVSAWILLFVLTVWIACGGSGKPSPGGGTPGGSLSTPAGTYTVTVNATSGSLNHAVTVTVTVQ